MPNIDDQLQKKKPFHKKTYRSYLSLDESLDGVQLSPEDSSAEISQKAEKIISQSEAKVEPKPEPIISQSEAKVEPNQSHVTHLSVTKVEPKPEPQLEPIISQSEAKVEPNQHLASLVGIQRSLLFYVYESCRFNGEKVSGPLSLQSLVVSTKSTKSAVKKAVQRLEEKQFIQRINFKDGRGGWTQYGLTSEIYNALMLNETRAKVEPIISQSRAKVGTEVEPKPEPRLPIVVVSNSNSSNTNNTEPGFPEEPCFVIPSELSGKVSRRQLLEFVLTGKISESDLQLSLDAFAYDLKNKLVSMKHSSNPVGLLIGAIKNNGSYNSAKYIEALKSELKPFVQSQREVTSQKVDLKNSSEWQDFQKFKTENPDHYETLAAKISHFGFKGDLLEDFVFLDFTKTVLKVEPEANLNPLRPHESRTI
jgi:predicted transcriptional regulator